MSDLLQNPVNQNLFIEKLYLDSQLNKTAIDLVVYSLLGYGVGAAASLFFKRKTLIRNLGAGLCGGYQLSENSQSFPKWRND